MANYLNIVFNVPLFQIFTYKNVAPDETGKGRRVKASFGTKLMTGFVVDDLDEKPADIPSNVRIKTIEKFIDAEPLFGDLQIENARWIAKFYLCSFGEALSSMLPQAKKEKELIFHSLDKEAGKPKDITLSSEQKNAIDKITETKDYHLFYLYGITGSGKTEVFLRSAKKIIEEGKTVLYLVPEISLTHQAIEDASMYFVSDVAIIHSGLTPSEKLLQWKRISKGEVHMVIGTRSAIFANFQNLGLIIIDEEHDSSYKSGATPRFHARQVAMHIASIKKCPVVMASATPSCEAWYMMEKGVIEKLSLTKRLAGGAMPYVEVVNIKGVQTSLSSRLLEEIRITKNMGKQSVIFLNRRGFTYIFHCKSCSYQMMCKNCSVPLTLHKDCMKMKCHYCGYSQNIPQSCPECGSLDIGYAGFGTEYVEEELKKALPDCIVARLDTDSAQKKGYVKKTIKDFKNGKIDILLGTQMIAKGLNFPNVRLVGIAFADVGLNMPDFRSYERTFSLIMQAAGRAGRYSNDGIVIIQTLKPEHPAIVCAKHFDSSSYYQYEINEREFLGFPPHTRLVRLSFRSKNEQKVIEEATKASLILERIKKKGVDIMGPSECMLYMVAGNYRMHLILRAKTISPLLSTIEHFNAIHKIKTSVYLELDVDPLNLL